MIMKIIAFAALIILFLLYNWTLSLDKFRDVIDDTKISVVEIIESKEFDSLKTLVIEKFWWDTETLKQTIIENWKEEILKTISEESWLDWAWSEEILKEILKK